MRATSPKSRAARVSSPIASSRISDIEPNSRQPRGPGAVFGLAGFAAGAASSGSVVDFDMRASVARGAAASLGARKLLVYQRADDAADQARSWC